MLRNIHTESVLCDLEMVSTSMESSEKLEKAYELFESNQNIPGIILTRNNSFFRVLSKTKFYKIMSKQFMFDVFAKRPAHYFFDNETQVSDLILNCNLPILVASTIVLQRDVSNRFEPIIVDCGKIGFKLLDYFTLLQAENQVHILTSNLLREANEFKNEVLGIVVHDLRNPLSNIIGSSEFICNNPDQIERVVRFGEIIYDSSILMNDMITDFLGSALHDSTSIQINNLEFDLLNLLNQIIHNFQIAINAKKQDIQLSGQSVILLSDKQIVREIIENLLSNAIKYSPFSKTILINLSLVDNSVVIQIQDEGPGLTQEDKSRIFGKFQKLSARPTGKESSTGLGLYITKKMVEKLNGEIWVDSELGNGCSFFVKLPFQNILSSSADTESR